tara:strand:+ start:5599 stop:5964 length:366 start_codon:yes stop_codon:yes gene_type:complete
MKETNKGNKMNEKLNTIDLSNTLELRKFVKELIKEETGDDVVEKEYDSNDLYIYTTELTCCSDELEDGLTYDFCLEDETGDVFEIYCGSKCYLRKYNGANRFTEGYTLITKEQFEAMSIHA